MRYLIVFLCLLIATACLAENYQGELITTKQLVGNWNEPRIVGEYWMSIEDTTARYGIADPNVNVVKFECDNATLDAILADANYGEAAVLWYEPIVEGVVP